MADVRPTEEDLRRVLAFAAELGEVDAPDALVERVLAGLLEFFPALSVSWNELDLTEGLARAVIRPDPGAAWYAEQRQVFARLMHQSPLVTHVDRTGDTRALRWEDVAEPGAMQRTELYERFYRPLGIESQLVVTLPAPPGVLLAVAVNRGPEGFSERERAILGLLRAHVVNAYRNVCHRLEAAALRSLAAENGWQVILVDGSTRIIGASRAFEDQALGVGERLPPRLVESLDRAIASLTSERIAVASDPVRLHVDDRPTQAWMVGSEVGPHVGVLRREVEPPLSELADLGLSPREVEVALALADGGTNERLARRLGIAVGTLRKHLERVYAVLDVSDRTSAAARVRALALGRAASKART